MHPHPSSEQWIGKSLAELDGRDLLRELSPLPRPGAVFARDGQRVLNFCCNDYLGLSQHPTVIAAARSALDEYGAGATASRLVSGSLELHESLERRLAKSKGYPSALVFGSGFLTNVGIVNALVDKDDTVFADRLIHASLIDAIRLSGAALKRFRHNSADHLEKLMDVSSTKGKQLVVTESVFSMDGDTAPLHDLAAVSARHGAMMMVDEAHSCGISHPTQGLQKIVNLTMGTLSKGLGGYGGFVACSEGMRQWLVNRARSFIYTTALPPSCIGAAIGALDVLENEPGMGKKLLQKAAGFRAGLQAAGLETGASTTQIVPVMVGDNAKALAFTAALRARDIHCMAIRPPTVPVGTARVRFSVSLAHTAADLEFASDQIIKAAREEHLL